MKKLTFYVNNQVVYEDDRNTSFDEPQLMFFDKMDSDMERGIKIKGELITNPDKKMRTKFVVMNFIKALQQENEAVMSALCAYLVCRHPTLVEVHANDDENGINIKLIEEQLN